MKFREAFENFITSKYVLGVLVVLTVYQIIQMLKIKTTRVNGWFVLRL